MIDPTSIGTALTVLAAITVLVIAFGLAILSDMAMRRREDRAAASTERTAAGTAAEPEGPATELPNALHGTEAVIAHAPTGAVAANGRASGNPST